MVETDRSSPTGPYAMAWNQFDRNSAATSSGVSTPARSTLHGDGHRRARFYYAVFAAHTAERSAMYDVIVIGARCAGASTALLLGRKGYKVLLVDRARFPSDVPHGHFIHRHGPQRLTRWGLLDRITATNCPPVT